MRLPPIFILAGSIFATAFAESGEFNSDYFSSLFADWKPIASSRDTSYFDYFALDKSESSFAVKIPSRESLIGENNSREERGHRWSSQSQNPPVGSRKYWNDNLRVKFKMMCLLLTRIDYTGDHLAARSGMTYEQMREIVEENLTVEKVEIYPKKIIKSNISNSGLPPLSQWAILRFTNSLFQFSWCGQWWRWQWSLARQGLPWLLPPFPSHRWELAPFYVAELFREIFLMNVNIIHCPNWSWENSLLLNHGW